MTTPDPSDPDRPQPLNYHRPTRPTRRPRVLLGVLLIVLLTLFAGAAVLFGTCWMAFRR
jgi:hypothetical protein